MIYLHLKQMLSELRSCLCFVRLLFVKKRKKKTTTTSDAFIYVNCNIIYNTYELFWCCLAFRDEIKGYSIRCTFISTWTIFVITYKLVFNWQSKNFIFYFFLHIFFHHHNNNENVCRSICIGKKTIEFIWWPKISSSSWYQITFTSIRIKLWVNFLNEFSCLKHFQSIETHSFGIPKCA